MYIRSGELVIIFRVNTNEKQDNRPSFFKSLRFRLTIILVVIGILPGMIVGYGIVSSYKDRAVSIRTVNVMNQCDILSDQIINENYLQTQQSVALNSELELLSNIYSGRVLIIDGDFRIVKDTFNLDVGKTMISEEILLCYQTGEIGRASCRERV